MASFLFIMGTIYVCVTTLFIVMENRRPPATFAWMLLFFSFPGLGVLIYILFGRDQRPFSRSDKLAQQNLTNRLGQVLSPLLPQYDHALRDLEGRPGAGARVATLVRHNAHSVLTTENRVDVLQDAAETYPRLIEDLRNARSFIHLQYYSWSSDAFGRELKSILLAKAAAGVEVRVLFDPVGSFRMLNPFYVRAMRRGGVRMLPFSQLWRLHTISYRNHRKIAVIDGEIGHTGGLNIGHEHIDPGPDFGHCWRDTHVRVAGAAASVLQTVFAVDWLNATGEDLLEAAYFPPVPADAAGLNCPVHVTLSGPDSQWKAIRQLYFKMIVSARRRVSIQSPFFILDATIAEALKAAALAGIDVRIMLSERGVGQFVPYWAANTYIAEVAEAGARVFLYRPGYLHAKTISIDGEVCSIGSANIDIRSFSINYELNAVIYDQRVAGELEDAFNDDLARCVEFDPEQYRHGNAFLRLRDSVARLFSPLL